MIENKEVYNAIECFGISVVSRTENLDKMTKVVEALISRHKELVLEKKHKDDIQLYSKYFG